MGGAKTIGPKTCQAKGHFFKGRRANLYLADFHLYHANIKYIIPLVGPKSLCRRLLTLCTLFGVSLVTVVHTTTAKAFLIDPGVLHTVPLVR